MLCLFQEGGESLRKTVSVEHETVYLRLLRDTVLRYRELVQVMIFTIRELGLSIKYFAHDDHSSLFETQYRIIPRFEKGATGKTVKTVGFNTKSLRRVY
jgi:hypothetical protein